MTKLKPSTCPGSHHDEPHEVKCIEISNVYQVCCSCRWTGPLRDTEERAIQAWLDRGEGDE